MDPANNAIDIAHIIQLAVAPVFLLTGIAAFLGVLSNRLGRITDRARVLERREPHVSGDRHAILHNELVLIWKRVKLTNKAIRLCTSSALLVCLVVVALFLGDSSPVDLSGLISTLFITAMIVLIIGLVYFLREIAIATQTMRIGMEFTVEGIDNE